MKRKDDDLLRLAFGELADDAARAVEARADAAERAEIEAFRSLRQGLQHLPPPPPDGLSADRLRAAILDRELRARPKGFAWGAALFMPAAVAALAAVVLLPRMRPSKEVQIVADVREPAIDRAAPDFKFDISPLQDFSKVRSRAAAKPMLQPQSRSQESQTRMDAPRRRLRQPAPVFAAPERREDNLFTLNIKPSNDEEGAPSAAFSVAKRDVPRPTVSREPMTIAAPVSTVVEHTPGKGGDTETVVIVSNKRDIETGALAATEKEVSSVLVGG